MKIQEDNLIASSFLLYLDNVICNEGKGYRNINTNLYPVNNLYNNLYAYGLPFKQAVADSSVFGAKILSGIYIDNSFKTIGQNNITGINHYEGQVYFTAPINASSLKGEYAIKDFNIYFTNKSEEHLIFEESIKVRPKTYQSAAALDPSHNTIPAIFIKNIGGGANPFAFGGVKKLTTEIRCVVITDNLYDLDALCSLLKEKSNNYVPIIDPSDLKVSNLNSFPSGYFNYSQLSSNSNKSVYIDNIYISKNTNINTERISKGLHSAFIDFILSNIK